MLTDEHKEEIAGKAAKKVDLGSGYFPGGGFVPFKYISVTSATYTISEKKLVQGTNIIGVSFAGAVTITLPQKLKKDKIIVINDESGAASSNNITVQVAS